MFSFNAHVKGFQIKCHIAIQGWLKAWFLKERVYRRMTTKALNQDIRGESALKDCFWPPVVYRFFVKNFICLVIGSEAQPGKCGFFCRLRLVFPGLGSQVLRHSACFLRAGCQVIMGLFLCGKLYRESSIVMTC